MVVRNVLKKCLIALISSTALIACGERSLDIQSLGLSLQSPILTSINPFLASEQGKELVISGECHPRTTGLSIVIGNQYRFIKNNVLEGWPAGSETLEGADTDCSDGTFSIPLTENNLAKWNINGSSTLAMASKIEVSAVSDYGYSYPVAFKNPSYVGVFSYIEINPTLYTHSTEGLATLKEKIDNYSCTKLDLIGRDQEWKPVKFSLAHVNFYLNSVAGGSGTSGNSIFNGIYSDPNCQNLFSSTAMINDPEESSKSIYIRPRAINAETINFSANVTTGGSYGFGVVMNLTESSRTFATMSLFTPTPQHNSSLNKYFYKFKIDITGHPIETTIPININASLPTGNAYMYLSATSGLEGYSTYLNSTIYPGATESYFYLHSSTAPTESINAIININGDSLILNSPFLLSPYSP